VEPVELTRHELIGLKVDVVASTNPAMVGIAGRVVDETRNTLMVDACGDRRLPKDACTFAFTLPDGRKVRVDGARLVGRPEDRITKRRKRSG